MTLRTQLLLVASTMLSLVTSACHDRSSELTASGTWRGKDGDRAVLLRIVDTDGVLSGSGTIQDPDGAILVEGTRVEREIALNVQVEIGGGYAFGQFQGELRSSLLVGQLSGLAFSTDRILLLRLSIP